jgi:ribulose 1,5-bisphosphate synthetase/thiazole synthase
MSTVHESFETEVSESYDVIVAGGGASGLMAAVAAAREGAKTLLLEREGCLGGTATTGYVAQYVGFYNHDLQAVWGLPYEFVRRIMAAGGSAGFGKYTMAEAAASPVTIHHFPFNPEVVKMVADDLVEEAGVHVLLHATVAGVIRDGNAVTGLKVETVAGRKAYGARVVVDATGDALVAHQAGVEMLALEPNEAPQPASLCFRLSNVDVKRFRATPREEKRAKALQGIQQGELFWESMSFVSTPGNTDAICLMSRIQGFDPLEEQDISKMQRVGRAQVRSIVAFLQREVPGFENAILAGIAPRVGVRETRRIRGQYLLTAGDILAQRQFEDAIALGCGPMDVHEANGTGIALSMPPGPFQIPMRCLLPQDVEGLIVTGRAISATHEANGGARHMATAMALGHAAGAVAAVCSLRANSTLMAPSEPVRAVLRKQGAALGVADCEAFTAQEAKATAEA